MATRNMLFEGRVLSSPAAATIVINDVEVYSGLIGVGKTLDEQVDLVKVQYNGLADTTTEDLSVSITMTTGVAAFGLVYVDVQDNGLDTLSYEGIWSCVSSTDIATLGQGEGRKNILINGLPPEWPATPATPMPLGTEENPDWSYWHFEISAGETLAFDYTADSFETPPPPATPI